MAGEAGRFQTLFKKYRLKAELSTLSQLGGALAEKGFIYEDSIFSHWQRGTRIPQNRIVLLKLLEIFVERKAITTLAEANEFLSSTGEGYLTEQESKKMQLSFSQHPPFQVPNQIENFTGREDIIEDIVRKRDILGKVILIYGAAGVGKTALAIELGHLLKNKFADGVFWYKVEEDNIQDILFSIAHIFGEDISQIKSIQTRATVVRAIIASKNALIILDSGELNENIYLLLPNSSSSTTIVTSQKNHFKNPIQFIDVPLKTFTNDEVLALFKEVLKEKYHKSNQRAILNFAKRLGNLPLAIDIFARQVLHANVQITQLPSLLDENKTLLKELHYEDKNLHFAIDLSYKKLESKMKSVLVSASIFKGKDFSVDSIAYINGLSITDTTKILQNLIDLSLIEHSAKNRYRIHPAIREFVRDKLDSPRSSYLTLIAIFIFLFFALWWFLLPLFEDKNNVMHHIFAGSYFIIALYGAICGIHVALKWGGLKTLMGRAIFMFSCGLFGQVFGQNVYTYLDVNHQIMYPSLGDIGYFGTIPFYIYGAFLLAESSGIKINIQSFKKKIVALIVPLIMVIIAYTVFLQSHTFDFRNPIKIFLDFATPLGEAMYISLTIITFIFSRTVLDGIMRSKAFLLLVALFFEFIADYIFIYSSSSYYAGNIVDFILLAAYFVMTLALISLKSLQVKIKNM